MKFFTSIFIFLFFLNGITAQNINKTTEYKPNKFMLIGKVDKNGFKQKHFNWFDKNHKKYATNDKIINQLKDSLKDYTIKVFFGSWCGDSKKNIPIFYKVLDQANFPEKNLEVIAVDRKKEAYKQAPNREEKGLNIHRVPTFIFYKNGKEINRIVEHPKETIERDILKIVSGKKYNPHYKAVAYLEKLLKKTTLDSLAKAENELVRYLTEIAKGSSELNTYGRVKWRANDLQKAQFILELNTKMHPNYEYPFETLGNFYYEQKEYYKALKNYYKSLSIYPKNKEIKERIATIETSQKRINNLKP